MIIKYLIYLLIVFNIVSSHENYKMWYFGESHNAYSPYGLQGYTGGGNFSSHYIHHVHTEFDYSKVYNTNFPNAENPYGPLSPNESGFILTLLNVKKR